ncbi:malto-oligosyltrehalose synthase [Mucilaginibacter sp. MD40]|uniref:malto-oligosyltrehalose synthase n=1 Tax=Mucilaginibacter sp. MD40 TaxID=2029590 RepID=UPI002101645F|nr:malto-oligosyltrehalose synthase [Mucilaginibacter sp. MD40]
MQTVMFNPVSTYRIQFHKDFTFSQLDAIIPYLKQLGVKTLYASPIFSAVPGSNHGYDGTDPLTINPEIGTLNELRNVSRKLKEAGISWLQDIVPNHMAFHHHNEWLMDLLKNGPESKYKNYFDQSLAEGTLFHGPIMVPFLGDDLQTVIDSGELKLINKDNNYFFSYADQEWPVNNHSVKELQVEDLDVINDNKEQLLNIAAKQHYRLCSWKETDEQINYRRFFTVNSLICINIQNKEVFDHFHQFIHELVKEDIFQGIRIDHIDGLYDPDNYLKRLRELLGEQVFIVAEKILAHQEDLPAWPIQGTTGYDFLAQVNNLFTNTKAKKPFSRIYERITGNQPTIDEQIKDKKRLILTHHMNGELNNLTNLYIEQGLGKSEDKELIKHAIESFLVNFPVYRHYYNQWPLSSAEQQQLNELTNTGYDLFSNHGNLNSNDKYLQFYQRCMQFSGPLMAKGVEDTLMYTYNRFIGHNEVGDSPAFFGIDTDAYHLLMQNRRQKWPSAINATSTHDTKRGEDVRARLNVLTYLHDEWQEKVTEWQALNKDLKTKGAPDSNDEYFIYQTLIGTYPALNIDTENYEERLCAYLEKVLREAKVHSSWANPNEVYETAVKDFASKLLDNTRPFWESFTTFWKKVKDYGVVNSLAQLVLKMTCPGTPDIYQGCELWDLSMVDPDNRRPVDYELRKQYLNSEYDINTLWENRDTGQIKAWLLVKLLELRSNSPDLFTYGEYKALKVTGKHADKVMAFARVHENKWIITAVPLSLTQFSEADIESLENLDWDNTKIHLPDDAPLFMHHLLTGFKGHIRKNIKLNEVFTSLPLAVLELTQSNNQRSAGVLLHITSLPSGFGVGDFGPAARTFAMLLKKGMQRYWQILPLSPVTARDGFSPYSSSSSQAGNISLISPEDLVEDGLLTALELQFVKKRKMIGLTYHLRR